jgi:general secretion pathway protein A
MYEQHYGLRERPFDLSANTKFLFLSAQHHEALTHLRYGLSGRPGITLLIGDAGMGKSTLIRAALQSETPAASRTVLLSNPTLTRAEFYEFLAREFEFSDEAGASKTQFLLELEAAIDACHQNGGVLSLIVDEAQSLPFELLEELRLLTNTEGESRRSITLLLVGQPELSERLQDPTMRQLKQRIALRAELRPFTLRETAGYIAARITVAGGRADTVFTRDAVIAIHQGAKGLPRTISVICDNALVTGFADNVKPVGSDIIASVCADFHLIQASAPASDVPARPAAQPSARPAAAAPAEAVVPARAAEPGEPAAPVPATAVPAVPVPPAAAPAAADAPMFSDYTEPKRFSFFRGARR